MSQFSFIGSPILFSSISIVSIGNKLSYVYSYSYFQLLSFLQRIPN